MKINCVFIQISRKSTIMSIHNILHFQIYFLKIWIVNFSSKKLKYRAIRMPSGLKRNIFKAHERSDTVRFLASKAASLTVVSRPPRRFFRGHHLGKRPRNPGNEMSAYTFHNSTSFPGLFTISLHNLCLVWLIKNQRNLFFVIFLAQYTLYLIGRKRKKNTT